VLFDAESDREESRGAAAVVKEPTAASMEGNWDAWAGESALAARRDSGSAAQRVDDAAATPDGTKGVEKVGPRVGREGGPTAEEEEVADNEAAASGCTLRCTGAPLEGVKEVEAAGAGGRARAAF